MTDQIILSNSSIQTFKTCRRKFWLEQYRGLKPKVSDLVGPLPFGSRIHKALELYYGELATGITSEEANLPSIWAQLCEEDRMIIMSDGGDTTPFDAEAELGRIMLEGYLEWVEDEGIDSDLEIISQEERLEHEFLDGRVLMVGKIDQRVRRKSDNTRLIRDFKTTAQFATLEKTIDQSEQFLLYMLLEAFKREETDRVSGAIVTALRKTKRTATAKPPFYEQFEVSHNVFEMRTFFSHLDGMMRDILQMWDALDSGADHHQVAYPTPTRDCSWKCPFASGCRLFDDGSDSERWLKDNFENRGPFDYYGDLDPHKES